MKEILSGFLVLAAFLAPKAGADTLLVKRTLFAERPVYLEISQNAPLAKDLLEDPKNFPIPDITPDLEVLLQKHDPDDLSVSPTDYARWANGSKPVEALQACEAQFPNTFVYIKTTAEIKLGQRDFSELNENNEDKSTGRMLRMFKEVELIKSLEGDKGSAVRTNHRNCLQLVKIVSTIFKAMGSSYLEAAEGVEGEL